MKLYAHVVEAAFVFRPNRFIALCRLGGETVACHVKNTGRLGELLLPGARVYLAAAEHIARKTRWDLVCVENRGFLVNIDSQAPNALFAAWAASGRFLPELDGLQSEVRYGASRLDFAYTLPGRQGLAEVKGVTLFDDEDVAYFPDAPTERGVKHLHALIAAKKAGLDATLCFVAQRAHVAALRPNDRTHPAFGEALRLAQDYRVRLICAVCDVQPDGCAITGTAPVDLLCR